jgi:DNA-binding NarL/FixJ family response regulator
MLVDDHPVMRKALRAVIDAQPDLTVAGEAESGAAALELVEHVRPDVVLMDGSMPGMTGMETTRQLKQLHPVLKIIGITLYQESTYLEEMIAMGVSGYILKTAAPSVLIEALHIVAAGGTYFDSSVARRHPAAAPEASTTAELSAEELTVAKLVAEGQTNDEIASTLNAPISVVAKRRVAAMEKLGLRTRAELVQLALRRRWLTA